VILNLFSRYVTGCMVALRESAELAKRLIEESCKKQRIQPGQLTLHADRDTSMTSKPVAPFAGRSGRHQDASLAARLKRQPVLGKPLRTLKYRPSSRIASNTFKITVLSVRDFLLV